MGSYFDRLARISEYHRWLRRKAKANQPYVVKVMLEIKKKEELYSDLQEFVLPLTGQRNTFNF